ncbi:uncharacterized protein LOC112163819 [Rosa chinensis]|uniref:uncharacterized protein LOC112163819 n=1 Tax=Rosa chinensis TaxID=74649 RepID=UPI001AD8A638|nr:uncharacterized protein LOC112163819 [Rosa chinensis]
MLSKELGNYRHALTDAEEAIRLRNTNVKFYSPISAWLNRLLHLQFQRLFPRICRWVYEGVIDDRYGECFIAENKSLQKMLFKGFPDACDSLMVLRNGALDIKTEPLVSTFSCFKLETLLLALF